MKFCDSSINKLTRLSLTDFDRITLTFARENKPCPIPSGNLTTEEP